MEVMQAEKDKEKQEQMFYWNKNWNKLGIRYRTNIGKLSTSSALKIHRGTTALKAYIKYSSKPINIL